MNDRRNHSGITLAELIPSKDVCSYMKQQGHIVTDFEKATLIYHHSGMNAEEKTVYLKELYENTGNMELKAQILERLEYDERCQKRFYEKKVDEIYQLLVYSPSDDEYLSYGHYPYGELAVRSGKKFQEKFYVQKIKLFTEENIQEQNQETAARYFNADGALRGYYSLEVPWTGQKEEADQERFENAYVEIPFPFRNGDFVKIKNHADLKDQICLVECCQDTEAVKNHEKFCFSDYSDATIRVTYICEKAEFGHAHVNIVDVEYAELKESDPKNMLLQCAQSLLRGYGGLSDFQYVCEEYCRKTGKESVGTTCYSTYEN